MKRILAVILAIFSLGACSTHLTDFTMISTKNVSLDKVDIDKLPQKKNVIGEDKKFMFLFIPFGVPTIQAALNNALEKGNGDLMVDVAVEAKGWWFLIGETGFEIKGNVVNTIAGEQK